MASFKVTGKTSSRARLWKTGDHFIWVTGGALVFSLLMVGGLLALIMFKGLGFFWPADLVLMELRDGSALLGQVTDREKIPLSQEDTGSEKYRVQLKIANRDIYGLDFRWVDEDEIVHSEKPAEAVLIERREWGNFHGFPLRLLSGESTVAAGEKESMEAAYDSLARALELHRRIEKIERGEIGRINHLIEKAKRRLRALESEGGSGGGGDSRTAAVLSEIDALNERYLDLEGELASLYRGAERDALVLATADGSEKRISMGDIVRIFRPNGMTTLEKARLYGARIWEFVSAYPRESNTEGGVFPAIFGTVMMVLIMTVAVMPFGVVAAVYLREYAKQGVFVGIVRVCVNNLAGVPSIVFGVFGLGFFIYGIGGSIDSFFFADSLPTPTYGTGGILWASLTLALLTLPVVIVSTEEGLAAVPQDIRHGSLALGANKFETLVKVVIPSAAPGILTGLILAIARATGEVAPLMITGVVKLAPTLPVDSNFPYVHLERKFMHLGFHIYDVGFQSPNVEAAKPMVYTTTLLLILIVVVLNLGAIAVRNYLRKRYASAVF